MSERSVETRRSLRGLSDAARRWSEPWYFIYALSGMARGGLVIILVPLIVRANGTATDVGVVMSALFLGGVTAPLWGELADRHRLHRVLIVSGLLVMGGALILFANSEQLALWFACMFAANAGASMISTVANLFVVDLHPRSEWEQRIGWLQSFYGGGQVLGLIAAALVTARMEVGDYRLGLALGGAVVALSALPAWRLTHTPPKSPATSTAITQAPRTLGNHGAAPVWSHHLSGIQLAIRRRINGQFARLLLVLAAATSAIVMFNALYPVLMHELFHIHPSLSSLTYSLAAVVNLTLYVEAGLWASRYGALAVLRSGLLARATIFALLFSITFISVDGSQWAALPLALLLSVTYSLISVSSTSLTVELAPEGRGAALGLYNAATALAGAASAILGGVLADNFGFAAVPLASALMILISFALSIGLRAPAGKASEAL